MAEYDFTQKEELALMDDENRITLLTRRRMLHQSLLAATLAGAAVGVPGRLALAQTPEAEADPEPDPVADPEPDPEAGEEGAAEVIAPQGTPTLRGTLTLYSGQ